MEKIDSLNKIIKFNSNFRSSVNLYLSLNKPDKVLEYIPTKSSLVILEDYLNAVLNNKEQATLLVGPYGKGKSHLLLVLLSILSMDRNDANNQIIHKLIDHINKVEKIGKITGNSISKAWKKKKYLPVLITNATDDLNQAFLYGLNEALKRDKLANLVPSTFYSIAIERINEWEKNYFETYRMFKKKLEEKGVTLQKLIANLKMCSKDALMKFEEIYPEITAGSKFNPMAVSDVLPLYKSVCEKLVEEYNYSGIYIIFDEFSKFIESQDGKSTGANMKLLQDICELSMDSKSEQIFVTMVAHKSIKEYGKYLSQDIINSFTGIEGRIIEKFFVSSSKNNYELIKNAIVKNDQALNLIPHYDLYLGEKKLQEYYSIPYFKSNFLEDEFKNIIFRGCYPLNPLAAYLLLNISEKVAQNERTLFTFISNDEPKSMARFVLEHTYEQEWSVGADLIYDYFSPLFKKDVLNEFVHNIWLSAEYAIERCQNEDQRKIIKALAVVLIVNKDDELPAISRYIKLCVNVADFDQTVIDLQNQECIYMKNSTNTYVFKTRAGSELKAEIKKQRELKGDRVNYSKTLLDVTGKYYVIPRKYNTDRMMTRYFKNEFMDVDDFLNIPVSDAFFDNEVVDGKIITLYSFSNVKQENVKKHLLSLADKRLIVVCPKKGLNAKKQLKDYEIIKNLRENPSFTNNNEILKRELPLILDDLTVELEKILDSIYDTDEETIVIFFDGKKIKKLKCGNEELAVNECCRNLYPNTPIINNEMVNRAQIVSSQTKKTRKKIIQAILTHEDTPQFYEGSNQEATIYRSLFWVTGILKKENRKDINMVLDEINRYIDSCSNQRNSVAVIIKKLIGIPYGMRLGVIPFYFAYVLANRKEDIVLYFSNKEVQLNADIVVNMCEQPEDYSMFVSKDDLQKEKYIQDLNVLFNVEDNRNLSSNRIDNIYICMQRWYRALPQATRNLINISDYVDNENVIQSMKTIKLAMQKIEYNPFEILFHDLPEKFGTKSYQKTFERIKKCKVYYDEYFKWIESQAVDTLYTIWDIRRKRDLYHVLKEWYENQSKRSKQGLYNGRMTNFMSCLSTLGVYSDVDVAGKVVKAVMDVYIENWNTGAPEEFSNILFEIKQEIEAIREESSAGELELSFVGKNGEKFNKLYSYTDENSGSVLRNIIEDTLEEYDDLSVNDRVSILLEMIEKIIK